MGELFDLIWKGFVYEHIVEPVAEAVVNWFIYAPTDCCNTLQSGDLLQ